MSKRMIMGIAAGVVAGATVIGVPAIALAANGAGAGTGVPAVQGTTNLPGGFQQMQQWMRDPQHVQQMQQRMNDPQHVQQMQQMQQWMDDPQHVQQMQQWMDDHGRGLAGMHPFDGQSTQPTP